MKNTLLKWVLGIGLMLAGVQSASAMSCTGTVHIKLPATWTTVNIVVDGAFLPITPATSGWTDLKISTYGSQYATNFIFVGGSDWNSPGITSTVYDVTGWDQNDKFLCTDFGSSNDLYIYENPAKEGETVVSTDPPNAKYLFVMIPPDYEDWMSSVPMISMDGGATGHAMTAAGEEMCGWYYYVWFNEEITDNVVLYRDDDTDREDLIGANGNWETAATATPIPLNTFFTAYNADTLYFVPDEEQLPDDHKDGWFDTNPADSITGTCSYSMAAIIYDTDASLHPAFSCYTAGGEGCQFGAQGITSAAAQKAVNACIGVTTGIVETYLDPSLPQKQRKPKLTAAGATCFISETLFNQLFNYTAGVNEKSCYNMPFSRSDDGKWEFDSDYYISDGVEVPGGFYPVETTDNATILAADDKQTPVPAARTKRDAEGAIFYGPLLRENDPKEELPVIDIFCNSSSWDGGYNCEGLFADGDGTTAAVQDDLGLASDACVFGWSCANSAPKGWTFYKSGTETVSTAATAVPRWNAERNQQYCFESHAKFTYKPGLKFNFRGDDDIWVFIDNTLAVDLGGTHLAAPGYVKLDNFKGYGGRTLEVGQQYDIDIFFCDRRTTMSNVRIKTNMYIKQTVSLEATPTTAVDENGNKYKTYSMCYTKTGDGGCASAMSSSTEDEITCCGAEIATVCGVSIEYYLVKGTSFSLDNATLLTAGQVNKGGIDLTDISSPKVYTDKMTLEPGKWTLFAYADGKPKKIQTFRTAGKVEVVYKQPTAVRDSNGEVITGVKYQYENSALAGELVPIYITAVIPANEASPATSEIDLSPVDAKNVEYTLSAEGLTLYEMDENGIPKQINASDKRTIGESGVDTLWVTVDFAAAPGTKKYSVMTTSSQYKVPAEIEFYLPTLAFTDSVHADALYDDSSFVGHLITGESKNESDAYDEYFVGSYVDLYVVALDPYGNLCKQCNFDLMLGSATSPKIEAQTGVTMAVTNGRALIPVRALKEFRYYAEGCVADLTNPKDDCGPATVALLASENVAVLASYSPLYFREPPVPYPVLSDVFDVHGATPDAEMNIPSDYYSSSQEYLDGIGDSVSIYYNRNIHQDSLPSLICFQWDTTTAEALNPYEMGISNKETDNRLLCNDYATQAQLKCVGTPNDSGYCAARIDVGGLKLSTTAKTGGSGKVISWAKFTEKGKAVTQSFDGDMMDRMAPVILSARVTKASDTQDKLVLEVSEQVYAQKFETNSFTFYLNSATSLAEAARFRTDVIANSVARVSTGLSAFYITGENNTTPHVGDYIRFSGDYDDVYWMDSVPNVHSAYNDSIRAASATDAFDYNWNAPTTFSCTKRLPSPWVQINGEAEVTVKEVAFSHTGNAPEGDNVPLIEVRAMPTTWSFEAASDTMGQRPGHFVQSDMFALVNSEDTYYDYFTNHTDELHNIYFYYNVEYYTNLGGYVGGQSGKIYCDDSDVFGVGKNCLNTGRNFYIAWNMRSDKGRLVGTGAYISKLQSYIKLGKFGKKNSLDKTNVWGVRMAPSTVK